jgi:hypothetical protein
MPTTEEKHLEDLATAIAREVSDTINEQWKKLPREGHPALRAQALDQVSMRLEALSAGFGLLAERCRDTAGNLLESLQS